MVGCGHRNSAMLVLKIVICRLQIYVRVQLHNFFATKNLQHYISALANATHIYLLKCFVDNKQPVSKMLLGKKNIGIFCNILGSSLRMLLRFLHLLHTILQYLDLYFILLILFLYMVKDLVNLIFLHSSCKKIHWTSK